MIGRRPAGISPSQDRCYPGFESGALQSLVDWQSGLWSIVGGLTAPIFQGGRLKANLEATKAMYRQTVAAYVNQVLIAYGDVEDHGWLIAPSSPGAR